MSDNAMYTALGVALVAALAAIGVATALRDPRPEPPCPRDMAYDTRSGRCLAPEPLQLSGSWTSTVGMPTRTKPEDR